MPRRRGWPLLLGVAFSVVAGVAIWYLADPLGSGASAHTVLTAVLLLGMALGPVLRRVRPRRVWFAAGAAGLFFVATAFDALVPVRIGPMEYSDAMFLSGYGFLILWLALMCTYGGTTDRGTLAATAASCTGAALALWVTILAPLGTVEDLATGIVWSLYPPLDIVILTLAAQLGRRLGRVTPPLVWFMSAMAVWLVVDTAYAVVETTAQQAYDIPVLEAAYLLAHFALAVAFVHPRLRELSPAPRRIAPRFTGDRSTMVLLTVFPVILSSAVPDVDAWDTMVRTLMITVLVSLVFWRLFITVSALSRAEADSHHRATHDLLTGLLNRAALLDALEDRLIRDAVTGRFTVVLFLDCNDFKRVNDTWGHHAGDTVLRDIATRLPAVLHPREIVARHGGDEFVVVSSTEDTAGAVSLAERVRSAFDAPLRIMPGRVHARTPAMGLALAGPDDRCTTEELLGRADAAMYESKQRGCGGHVVFDDALALRLRTRAEVGDRLEQVTCTDPFDIVLQPIMGGPEHRTLIGREALARWRDPQLGDVPPDVFVPVAEQLGLITTLGEAVLRRACREAAGLRATGEEDEVDLFVNVSPAQLRDPGFAGVVRDALATTGLPPARLRLEVTETELVDEGPATAETLEALREAGIRLCVDDFGTGYASLATLLRLPVDCVKLDRSLVAGLGESEAAERQLAAVMSLVRSLGIEDIVAEGVETEQQAIALLELGCPLVQGWFYGRPCPSADALVGRHLLRRRGARRDAGGPATADPP